MTDDEHNAAVIAALRHIRELMADIEGRIRSEKAMSEALICAVHAVELAACDLRVEVQRAQLAVRRAEWAAEWADSPFDRLPPRPAPHATRAALDWTDACPFCNAPDLCQCDPGCHTHRAEDW